jgi:hypothetical protein
MWKEQDGRELVDVIDDELTGDFKDGVMMLVKGQACLDAEVLWDALQGVGTDEERLNEIITGRHPGQIEEIKTEYQKLSKNDKQESLWDAICSDTTFKYERFLKSMLDRAGFLAFLCYEAMKGNRYDFTGVTGIGTNEDMLIRILMSVNRDNDGVKEVIKTFDDNFDTGWKEELQRLAHLPDIEDIKHAYPRLSALGFAVNEGDEESQTTAREEWTPVNNAPDASNPYNRDGTFFFCAKEAQTDLWEPVALPSGSKIWKHLTHYHVGPKAPAMDFSEYEMPSTYKLFKVPMGKSLAATIDSDMFLDQVYKGFKDVLLHTLKDKDVSGAEAINGALDEGSVCQDTIMQVMASRCNSQRSSIAQKYELMYGNKDWQHGMPLRKLKEDISEKLDGDFADVARDMFQDGDERSADYCFLAMHGHTRDDDLAAAGILIDESKQDGVIQQSETFFRSGMIGSMGTDEQRLNRIILYSNKSELASLADSYKQKFGGWDPRTGRTDPSRQLDGIGPTLFDDVFSELGGEHRRLIMYRFHQSMSGFMHVPRKKLLRKDDMPSNFPIDAIAKYENRKPIQKADVGVEAGDLEANIEPED